VFWSKPGRPRRLPRTRSTFQAGRESPSGRTTPVKLCSRPSVLTIRSRGLGEWRDRKQDIGVVASRAVSERRQHDHQRRGLECCHRLLRVMTVAIGFDAVQEVGLARLGEHFAGVERARQSAFARWPPTLLAASPMKPQLAPVKRASSMARACSRAACGSARRRCQGKWRACRLRAGCWRSPRWSRRAHRSSPAGTGLALDLCRRLDDGSQRQRQFGGATLSCACSRISGSSAVTDSRLTLPHFLAS
jgi:hypothetical protein